MPDSNTEHLACTPEPLDPNGFNANAEIPYGCTVEHIRRAMDDFVDFLGYINGQLYTKSIPRLEAFLMPANFSSMVGEFMTATIPKYCPTIAKNQYHNGHPDMLPKGMYPGDAQLHVTEGIEVKGSRYLKGWQGHNAENVYLMVFVFDSNTARDTVRRIAPKPFRFVKVVGAKLCKEDWKFSGRSATSRRTITASVTRTGYDKMEANTIYRAAT